MVAKSIALQFGPIRKKEKLDAAINELYELDRVRIQKDGKRTSGQTLQRHRALLSFRRAVAW